jgi:hypothetical protein
MQITSRFPSLGEVSMNADSIVLEEEIDPNYVPSEEEGENNAYFFRSQSSCFVDSS